MTNKKIEGYQKECFEVEQSLGIALKYPRYADDQKTFPGTTDADGVCVGEHTPATIAMEAAQRITSLEARVKELEESTVSKATHEATVVMLSEARRNQISLFDLDYPPSAQQGGPERGDFLELLTAQDVNHYLTRIQELSTQVAHLQTELAKVTMQRDGTYAKVDAIEEACVTHYRECKESRNEMQQRITSKERLLRRALLMIANARRTPFTIETCERASKILQAIESGSSSQTLTMNHGAYITGINMAEPDPRMRRR